MVSKRRLYQVAMVLIGLPLLHACSTPNPALKELPLSSDPRGNAISLNGYVTPIFSNRPTGAAYINGADGKLELSTKVVGDDRFIVCPAPPVDAIATINTGLSATDRLKAAIGGSGQPVTNDAQLALAISQAAATFGLRTNPTTLLSYNLASNCMAYMAGATENEGYMQLTRRNQLITFGILAIDSLTGGSKAGQAALGGTSGASTGQQDTTALSKSVSDSTTALGTAQSTQNTAQSEADTKRAELTTEVAKLQGLQAKSDALKADASGKADAVAAVVTQQGAVESKRTEVASANVKLQNAILMSRVAQHNVDRAQDALDLAEGSVRAMASGNASVGAASGFIGGSSQSIAESVERIVKTVSLVAQNGEFCDALIREYVHTPVALAPLKYGEGSPALKFIKVCSDVVTTTRDQLGSPGEGLPKTRDKAVAVAGAATPTPTNPVVLKTDCADGGCRLLSGKLNFPISKELADRLNAEVPSSVSQGVQPMAIEKVPSNNKGVGR